MLDISPNAIPAKLTSVRSGAELLTAVAVGVTAFVIYTVTLAPGVTWSNLGADGGDLLTAAFTWGIPHPSGYPTYLLGLRGFSLIFPLGDEAFRANLFSAALAATAASFVTLASLRLIEIIPSTATLRRSAVLTSATISGLAMAVSRELWSQATITEVYALNAFFVSVLLYGVITLYHRHLNDEPEGRLRVFLALVLGLGLGNHLTLAMMAVPFVVWTYTWSGSRSVALQLLRNWKVPTAFIAGLAVYLYAPLASSGDPLLNWGHPENADGFWWMISGSLYQNYQFGVEPSDIGSRLIDLGDLVLAQFAFVGLVLAIAGLTFIWESHRDFAIAGIAGIVLVTTYAIAYDTIDSFLYVIPVFVLLAVWMSVAIASVLRIAADLTNRFSWATRPRFWQWLTAAAILGAVPGFSAFANFDTLDLSDDRLAIEYAEESMAAAQPGSIIVASGEGELFSLWYQSYVAQPEADVLVVSLAHLQFDWYWDDIKAQAPDLLPDERPSDFAARANAVVDYNLGLVPVYAAGETDFYDREYTIVEDGPIFRFTP